MPSEVAKDGRFFRKTYRRGMIGLLLVTGIAAGGRLVWEGLTPKPEPKLSAQLTREYFDRFSRLGITAVKRNYRNSYFEVARNGKDTLQIPELTCPVPERPSGRPPGGYPPSFDIEREGRSLNVYGPIDKDNYTLPEYHDVGAKCLDVGLAETAHANQADASWGSS